MFSKNFFLMMVTVFAATATYYLLATRTFLSEGLSIAAGVAVAIIFSLAMKKIFNDRRR